MGDSKRDQGRTQSDSREHTQRAAPIEGRNTGEHGQQSASERDGRTEQETKGAPERGRRATSDVERPGQTAAPGERERQFMEKHPAGYLAARLTASGSRDAGYEADRGLGGGFDHGRGIWGAPGEVRASGSAHTAPMHGLHHERTVTERIGHPDIRDEPGYGAHGFERPDEGPFDLNAGGPTPASDAHLRSAIERALGEEPELDARGVAVSVRDAEVFLQGSVPEAAMKERAVQVSRRLEGVRQVHDELTWRS